MKGVQCYELFGGIALKIHTFSFHFHLLQLGILGCSANPTPRMRRATVGRPLQKNVQPVPVSTREPSSGSLVSLRAAMSILYLASSQAMSAVRRRAPNPVSCRVRTFKLATTRGLCLIEEFILYFFRPRVGYPCGCGRPPGKGGTGNVWATFSRPLLQWR